LPPRHDPRQLDAAAGRENLRRVADEARFELYLPTSLAYVPDALHLDVQRFPRRVEAYWNNCAYVI
jgi:hypothetical protein